MSASVLNAQENAEYVRNDSIYFNEELVGLVKYNGKTPTGVFTDRETMLHFREKRDIYPMKFYSVDDYILRKRYLINPSKQTIHAADGRYIGSIELNRNVGVVTIKLATNDFDRKFLRYCLIKSGMSPNISLQFKLDDVAVEEEKKRRAEHEKQLIIEEKQRIARFYAHVYERLKGELTAIEGVYKSIDLGEGVEYDIAILQSQQSPREFRSMVLSSTDVEMPIGSQLFSLTQTAQSNMYFVQYTLKSGESYENKIATLDGALLSMGVKSFIKMFPMENDSREYQEINPMFDWESSGSGVLINNSGYIATNNHVINGAKKIRIAFQKDSIDYEAVIISQNEVTDVAIIKIVDPRFSSNVKPVAFNNSITLGQKVFTLGYPISDKMSNNVKVVDGIVSGENGVGGSPIYFQTTLPVWYGNSGGPCFNSKGEILGLATQILWDKGEKVDNVAYVTRTENILNLGGDLIVQGNSERKDKNLEELINELIPYSVFIKVNY